MSTDIPTQVYVPLLGRVIEIHWINHAVLMCSVWLILVPVGILAIRFFKPRPTPYGIDRGTGRFDRRLIWWTIHYGILYPAIALAVGGVCIAVFVSGGFSGSVHATLGITTVLFGGLQIVTAWFRGSHGGKHGATSDPADPGTWRGDHFDMTPRRRWFEAYHKTGGYFAICLACGAIGSGLMRYWIPSLAISVVVVGAVLLGAFVVLEGKGFRQDTYRSVYGNHPDNPFNRERRDL